MSKQWEEELIEKFGNVKKVTSDNGVIMGSTSDIKAFIAKVEKRALKKGAELERKRLQPKDCPYDHSGTTYTCSYCDCKMTYELGREEERERCAKIAEDARVHSYTPYDHPDRIAKEIRNLSEEFIKKRNE